MFFPVYTTNVICKLHSTTLMYEQHIETTDINKSSTQHSKVFRNITGKLRLYKQDQKCTKIK